MKKLFISLITLTILVNPTRIFAQLFWSGPTNSWNSSNWSTSGATGTFTSPWVANSAAVFNVPNSLITGASISFSSIIANEDVVVAPSGTITTGGTIATITVASGKTFDFGSQNISTAVSTGLIKDGAGVLAIGSGNSYPQGLTINIGTVICRGINGLGAILTINGGVLAANANRTFATSPSSITIGGNFTLGATTGLASSTANLTFPNTTTVSLGTTQKIIILNGTGINTFNGILSGNGGGINVASGSTGTLQLSGANTYTGGTTLSGGTLRLGASEVIANISPVTMNGGILRTGAFSETYSTLSLTENSTINLDPSLQIHNFEASNLISWTSGKTLKIIGWTGNYNSTSGTGGKIFFGNNSTGLTAQQLSQIKFFNGIINSDATQLSTGEVVPTGSLPITLTSFTGKEANKLIVLNWITASEKNNKNFEVLRSVDGNTFKTIGTVDGAGDSNAELKYSFVDANPFGGTNYYQLKQIDFDGKSSTSYTVAVDSKISETHITVIASSSSVNIGITSPNESDGKLSLFDMSGRKITLQNIKLSKGYNSIVLNENLNTGVHFVTLENEGKLYSQKFIK